MKPVISLFRSFRFKVALVLILAMLFLGAVSNFLIYEYSIRAQLDQLRDELMIIVGTASLTIDAETLLEIPLNKDGVESLQYKTIAAKLSRIKDIDPSIVYIYAMTTTEKPDIFKFIIDLKTNNTYKNRPPAYPGDEYDGSRFPELLKAFTGPSADKHLVKDEWGVFLSGYTPIYDKNGRAVAILGIDMAAEDVYNLQKEVRKRILFVLFIGIILSLALGTLVPGRVTKPIKKLVEGTRHIGRGDLQYQVKVKGDDEISELAVSFNKMAANLFESHKKLLNYFYRVVQSLVRALEARDPYTKGHSDRVAEYSEKIAFKMGLSPEKIELLREAALLHDIGKLGVQEMILNKSLDLTDKEREDIRRHPAIGEDILKPVSLDKEILAVVRGHHERYDGKGYPDKISGDNIDLLASIVAVADSYDAMTSHRSYRKDLNKEEATEQLKSNSGTQFNPKVVDAFLEVLRDTR